MLKICFPTSRFAGLQVSIVPREFLSLVYLLAKGNGAF